MFEARHLLLASVAFLAGCAAPPAAHQVIVDESADRGRFGSFVRQMLERKEFDQIEALADSFARCDSRWPSGAPRLTTIFLRGFNEVDDVSEGPLWTRHMALLEEWVKQRPESGLAKLALAEGFIGRGEAARGMGWAHSVSQEDWQELEREMKEGARILASVPDSARGPNWTEALLLVLHMAGGEADSTYRALVQDALYQYPEHHRFYLNMAIHLLPRWYGAEGEWERFAEESTNQLPDSIRDEFYARIVESQSKLMSNVFQESRQLSWSRTRLGLEAWQRRYPVSIQPRSALAKLAFQAGDRQVARRAFASLGDTVELEIWGRPEKYWRARRWATKGD